MQLDSASIAKAPHSRWALTHPLAPSPRRGARGKLGASAQLTAASGGRAGVDVRALADLMGHSRADVSLNVYAASGEDAKLAAAAKMEAWGG